MIRRLPIQGWALLSEFQMAGPRGIGSVYWPVGTNTHRKRD